MKKSKHFLASLMVVVMVLTATLVSCFVSDELPNYGKIFIIEAEAASYGGTFGDNLKWEYNDTTNVLTVFGNGSMPSYISSGTNRPWEKYKNSVREIIIENGVTNIGEKAFNDFKNLRCVTMADSVLTIGSSAFANCSRLSDVNFSNKTTSIEGYAFSGCTSLVNLILPNRLTYIGISAFTDCTGLKNVTMPTYPCTIQWDTFRDCTGIEKVNISSITSWCSNYFGDVFSSPLNYGADLYLNGQKVTSVTIPNGYTYVGDYVFQGCTSLTSVKIPTSIKKIGKYAFSDCSNLLSVEIPDSVVSIGEFAFDGCTNLPKITIPNSVTEIGDYAFRGCESFKSIIIPNSVTIVSRGMLANCKGLTNVTLPNTITQVGYAAFENCINLKSIVVPNRVTMIGKNVFNGCTSLSSITLSDKITIIYDNAFKNCKSLTSITIPDKVTSIEYSAFYGCTGLKELTMPASAKIYNYTCFYNCTNIEKITLTKGKGKIPSYSYGQYVDEYTEENNYSSTPWYISRNKCAEIILEDGITSIGWRVFTGCVGLKKIVIPDSVTEIGRYAFEGCSGLKSVTFGDGIMKIGDYVFNYCDNITDVYVTRSEYEWGPVIIGAYNGSLEKATIHFNHNHSYKKEVESSSTCIEYGKIKCICDCGHILGYEATPLGECNPSDWIIDISAGCKTEGLKHIECTVCGKEIESQQIDALGHNFGAWKITINATIATDGLEERACSRCNDTETRVIPAHGNVWSVSIDDISMNYKNSTTITPNITVDEGVDYTVSYISTKNSVAQVDENGNVYASGKGRAVIMVTVTDQFGKSVTDTCEVNVNYTFIQWLVYVILFGWIWY